MAGALWRGAGDVGTSSESNIVTAPPSPSRARVDSVDLLRGAVMILMALDHVRDGYSSAHTMGTDLQHTWPALFFTRWVTHFCAPVFVLLAGVGARFQAARGKSRAELSRFLLTRGLWLLVVELVWIHLGMTLDFAWHWTLLQTLWAIGWSMIALSALVWLPPRVVGGIGLAICLGHNLLDGHVGTRADTSLFWRVLEVGGRVQVGEGRDVVFGYPLLAWMGVMAAGYGFGSVFSWEERRRRRFLAGAGFVLVLCFLGLRALDGYGDPSPWATQKNGVFTLLSFLNCTKYPPSLLYLLMTLGPALLALALLDRVRPPSWNPMLVLGRVPLFFYCLHFWVISLSAFAVYGVLYGARVFTFQAMSLPDDVGFPLPVVYAIWAAVILALYGPSRWYAAFKRAHPEKAWLSYL
jgi:uncharacterized membrane protein